MNPPVALLMDLGNVLIKVEPGLMRQAMENLGVNVTETLETAFIQLSTVYEQGGMDSASFLDKFAQLTGITGQGNREKLHNASNSVFPENGLIGTTLNVCRRLKGRGIRLVLFSNTNQIHIEYLKSKYPELFSLFDDEIYSYITGAMKPAPPMYREAIEKLGLDPATTLYFDDKPENIEAALDFGFQAHVYDYNRPETFLDHLPEDWKA